MKAPLVYSRDTRPFGALFAVVGLVMIASTLAAGSHDGWSGLIFLAVGLWQYQQRVVTVDPETRTVEVLEEALLRRRQASRYPFDTILSVVLGDPVVSGKILKRNIHLELEDDLVEVTSVRADPPLGPRETVAEIAAIVGAVPIRSWAELDTDGEETAREAVAADAEGSLARAQVAGVGVRFQARPEGFDLHAPAPEPSAPGRWLVELVLLAACVAATALAGYVFGSRFFQGPCGSDEARPYFLLFGFGLNGILLRLRAIAKRCRSGQPTRVELEGATLRLSRPAFPRPQRLHVAVQDIGEMVVETDGERPVLQIRTASDSYSLGSGLPSAALDGLRDLIERAQSLPRDCPEAAPPPKLGEVDKRTALLGFLFLLGVPLLVGWLSSFSQRAHFVGRPGARAYSYQEVQSTPGLGPIKASDLRLVSQVVVLGEGDDRREVYLSPLGSYRVIGFLRWTHAGKPHQEWRCLDSANVPVWVFLACLLIGFFSIPIGHALGLTRLLNWGMAVFCSAFVVSPLLTMGFPALGWI